jgi:hypothetical protein
MTEARMAEGIIKFIAALIGAAFELLIQHTGRKVLSVWGHTSNPFIEMLIGLIVWAAGIVLVAVLIVALSAKP